MAFIIDAVTFFSSAFFVCCAHVQTPIGYHGSVAFVRRLSISSDVCRYGSQLSPLTIRQQPPQHGTLLGVGLRQFPDGRGERNSQIKLCATL